MYAIYHKANSKESEKNLIEKNSFCNARLVSIYYGTIYEIVKSQI